MVFYGISVILKNAYVYIAVNSRFFFQKQINSIAAAECPSAIEAVQKLLYIIKQFEINHSLVCYCFSMNSSRASSTCAPVSSVFISVLNTDAP